MLKRVIKYCIIGKLDSIFLYLAQTENSCHVLSQL